MNDQPIYLSPGIIDLVTRCEAISERNVCAAAVLDPSGVLKFAEDWLPQVDELSKEFWALLATRKQELVDVDLDIQLAIVADIMANVDYWLLYAYIVPGMVAIDMAEKYLTENYYLKNTRRGLPLVMKLLESEAARGRAK